jgi:diguanylate cyclase (GGDEF)-like protein
MFCLTLLILYILFYFWLYRNFRSGLYHQKLKLQEFNNDQKSLSEKWVELKTQNDSLSQKAESVVELYEITKDVCKSLEEEVIFNIFKEKLKHYIKVGDIQLVKENIDYGLYKEDLVVPLEIGMGITPTYFLVAKDVPDEDREEFHILTQQFLLGLRRTTFYRRIQDLAIHDSLTAILTRRYFIERLEEETKRSEKLGLRFSLLMADIDHFKECNDHYGHLVGDVVLKEVAKAIKDSTRQIDVVGRYGGEEFSIILTETAKEGAFNACERILKNVEEKRIKAYDEELGLTVSIGIAAFPEDAKSTQELIDKADWALYRAKQTGRNRICVYGDFK